MFIVILTTRPSEAGARWLCDVRGTDCGMKNERAKQTAGPGGRKKKKETSNRMHRSAIRRPLITLIFGFPAGPEQKIYE